MSPAIVRLWQAFFLYTAFVCGWFGRKTGKTYTLVRLTLVSAASKMMVYSDQKKRMGHVYKGKRMGKNLTIREVSYPRKCEDIVRILEQAEREGRLTETMAEEFLHPFSMQALWACRKYFHSLPEEVYQPQDRGSIALISVRALLASMEGQLGTAREYVSLLGKTPHHISLEDITAEDYVRLVTELVMPYTTDNQFLHIIYTLRALHSPPVQSLTLSAGRPSILDGFRDFTGYAGRMAQHREEIEGFLQMLYGKKYKGIYDIAMAEWHYQSNDSFRALLLVTGTIPLMENQQDIQCLFVAMALQMKILLLNGQMQAAAPLVRKIRERVQDAGWEEVESSLNALEAWAACYDGNREVVEEWLARRAPDEQAQMCMTDSYAYLVKIRCYLFTGKYMVAFVLANKLIHVLEEGRRHMDLCECYMLSAIACYKAGAMEDMCQQLEQSLRLARKYRYIRLLADEGTYMIRMLSVYRKRCGADDFTERIKDAAQEVARKLPEYMQSPCDLYEPLTVTEKQVLQLLAQGLTYHEMAEKLGKKEGSIKFHSSGIFKKLQVKNRQQAVNRAVEIGLL